MAVLLEVVDHGVAFALAGLRADLEHMDATWRQIGESARDAIDPFVPVASGRLVDSVKADADADSVEVGSDLIYAGVQDRGWPARNIAASDFMSHGEDYLEGGALQDLESAIDGLIRAHGL